MYNLMRYAKLLLTVTVLCGLGLLAVISFSQSAPYWNSRRRTTFRFTTPDKEELAVKEIRKRGMTTEEKQIALDLLKLFHITTKRLGIEYFLYSGTLLGSWRHHSMIPWDDDVDVIVDKKHQNRLFKALSQLKPKYFVYDSYDIRFKFWAHNSKPKSEYPWKWPYLDIQFYSGNTTHIWDIGPEFEDVKYPRSIIFPLHKRPFEGAYFPSPFDTLSTLQLNYAGLSSLCMTWHYSHKKEAGLTNQLMLPCAKLRQFYPFVHRRIKGDKIEETLKLGDKDVHKILVKEPLNSVTDPYSLQRLR